MDYNSLFQCEPDAMHGQQERCSGRHAEYKQNYNRKHMKCKQNLCKTYAGAMQEHSQELSQTKWFLGIPGCVSVSVVFLNELC